MGTLIKKIVIVLLLKGRTNQQIRDYARKSAEQATTFSTQYPAFVPAPTAMETLCDSGDSLASEKVTMIDNLKTITQDEAANLVLIINAMNLWLLIVQGMTGLTVALVTQLGWSTKTEGTANRTDMMDSSPVVGGSNQNVSKKIALTLNNSLTNKKAKPYGAKGWIPYTQIGGTKPTEHDLMTAEIPTAKMKYSKTFASGDLGKQFYVCFVWFDGTEFIGPDSPIYSFTII